MNSKIVRCMAFAALVIGLMSGATFTYADDDESAEVNSNVSAQPVFVINQPKPYTRAQEYIQPNFSASTLTGTPFTGGWGGNPYASGMIPYNSFVVGSPYPAVPFAGSRYGYGAYGGYGGGYMRPGPLNAFSGNWGGSGLSNPFTSSGNGFGYSGLGEGFPYRAALNGWGNGYQSYGNNYDRWGGTNPAYGMGYGGWGNGYSGYGNAFGAWGGGYPSNGFGALGGFPSGTELGLTAPSHVVQTEPSKASGNYYSPSTVDTTASGSYYAQTDNSAVQVPAKRNSSNANYWKPDSGSNYWGSGGGSATPFGKDLNSVPWNK